MLVYMIVHTVPAALLELSILYNSLHDDSSMNHIPLLFYKTVSPWRGQSPGDN